jgi:pimeloyl-ACP methyl ester carboxylesterase
VEQQVQYCTTPDGVRLAYSIIGKGSRLVRTSHWFSHLDHDLTSPIFRPDILGLAQRHELLRYDARGIGLSQRDVDVSFEAFVGDLEFVIEAAKFDRFILLGLSQGCGQAIAYAARHPDKVSHLILYGGYARGQFHRDDVEKQKERIELGCALIRNGWGSGEESHRQFFTSQFMPDADKELHHSLNETQRLAATPEMAERFLRANADFDVSALLPKITAPTLVLHPTGDLRVPFPLGQEMAAGIAGAKFVPLDTRNHMLAPNEPAHQVMVKAIAEFLGEKPIRTSGVSDRLDHRAKALEQHWSIKFVLVFAAITGCLIFFWEIWKAVRGGEH